MITYYIAGFPVTDELYHHGIKGQKWGLRRFQNEDGTLTSAGKARYGEGEKIAKAAGMAVGAVALAYGGRRLLKSGVGREAVERAKGKAGYMISKSVTNRQNKDDFKKYEENYYRGQALATRGQTAANTILRAAGRAALSGAAFGGVSTMNKSTRLLNSLAKTYGALSMVSIMGQGISDAYRINYYNKHKPF